MSRMLEILFFLTRKNKRLLQSYNYHSWESGFSFFLWSHIHAKHWHSSQTTIAKLYYEVRWSDTKITKLQNPQTFLLQQTWWFMIVADNLWISRSSWSAKSLDFVAAADKPQIAAFFTVSEEMDDESPVSQEDWLYFTTTSCTIRLKQREGEQSTYHSSDE